MPKKNQSKKKSKSKSISKSKVKQSVSKTSKKMDSDPTILDNRLVQTNNDFTVKTIKTTNNKGEQIEYSLLVPEYSFEDVITNDKMKDYKTSKARYKEYYDA